jgi:hypothetical protein
VTRYYISCVAFGLFLALVSVVMGWHPVTWQFWAVGVPASLIGPGVVLPWWFEWGCRNQWRMETSKRMND